MGSLGKLQKKVEVWCHMGNKREVGGKYEKIVGSLWEVTVQSG